MLFNIFLNNLLAILGHFYIIKPQGVENVYRGSTSKNIWCMRTFAN